MIFIIQLYHYTCSLFIWAMPFWSLNLPWESLCSWVAQRSSYIDLSLFSSYVTTVCMSPYDASTYAFTIIQQEVTTYFLFGTSLAILHLRLYTNHLILFPQFRLACSPSLTAVIRGAMGVFKTVAVLLVTASALAGKTHLSVSHSTTQGSVLEESMPLLLNEWVLQMTLTV